MAKQSCKLCRWIVCSSGSHVVLAILVSVAHLGLEDAVHAVAVEGSGAPPLVVPGAARVTCVYCHVSHVYNVTCMMSCVTCNSSYWKSQNSSTSQPDFGQFWMVNGQWQDSVIPAWILDRYYTHHLECYFTYYGNKRNNFIYLHLKFSSSFNATNNNLDSN